MKLSSILIVDEDKYMRKIIRSTLGEKHYDIKEADSKTNIISALNDTDFDLITMDIRLSEYSNLDHVEYVKKNSDGYVVIISPTDKVRERVAALKIGAEDYVTVPFEPHELRARIRALLRRKHKVASNHRDCRQNSTCIAFSRWVLNPSALVLRDVDGNIRQLTLGEFRLLSAFLGNPMKVLSRDQLVERVDGVDLAARDRAIDNQIARLRKKIEFDPSTPTLIRTVRGEGYKFMSKVSQHSFEVIAA
ncbi:MAG: response regulator transcription factor [Pseudomonadota bacterium]